MHLLLLLYLYFAFIKLIIICKKKKIFTSTLKVIKFFVLERESLERFYNYNLNFHH